MTVKRHAIGVVALILLAVGGWLTVFPSEWAGGQSLRAASLRLGPFLVVLWLAFPQLARLPAWLLSTVPVLVLLLAFRPRWFFIALPVVLALAILRPRSSTRRGNSG